MKPISTLRIVAILIALLMLAGTAVTTTFSDSFTSNVSDYDMFLSNLDYTSTTASILRTDGVLNMTTSVDANIFLRSYDSYNFSSDGSEFKIRYLGGSGTIDEWIYLSKNNSLITIPNAMASKSYYRYGFFAGDTYFQNETGTLDVWATSGKRYLKINVSSGYIRAYDSSDGITYTEQYSQLANPTLTNMYVYISHYRTGYANWSDFSINAEYQNTAIVTNHPHDKWMTYTPNFDDSGIGDLIVEMLLKKNGLVGTGYVVVNYSLNQNKPSPLYTYLNTTQLIDMQNSNTMDHGCHTYDHVNLVSSPGNITLQLNDSRDYLLSLFGLGYIGFDYPYGAIGESNNISLLYNYGRTIEDNSSYPWPSNKLNYLNASATSIGHNNSLFTAYQNGGAFKYWTHAGGFNVTDSISGAISGLGEWNNFSNSLVQDSTWYSRTGTSTTLEELIPYQELMKSASVTNVVYNSGVLTFDVNQSNSAWLTTNVTLRININSSMDIVVNSTINVSIDGVQIPVNIENSTEKRLWVEVPNGNHSITVQNGTSSLLYNETLTISSVSSSIGYINWTTDHASDSIIYYSNNTSVDITNWNSGNWSILARNTTKVNYHNISVPTYDYLGRPIPSNFSYVVASTDNNRVSAWDDNSSNNYSYSGSSSSSESPPFTGCNSTAGTLYWDALNNILTVTDVPCTSISGLSGRLNNSSVISNVSGVWNMNGQISLSNSNLYLNDSDISELRWDDMGASYLIYAGDGVVLINNISITGWNSTTDTRTNLTSPIWIYKSNINDVIMDAMGQILFYEPSSNITNVTLNGSSDFYVENMHNKTVYNLTSTNSSPVSYGAIYFNNISNMSIYDITASDMGIVAGISFEDMNNSTVYNLIARNIGYMYPNGTRIPESGGGGIIFTRGNNNTAHDLYIDNIGRSALSPNSNYLYLYNITINRDGHNGIDFHPGSNTLVDNITVTNSSGNAFYITSGVVGLPNPATNITIRNMVGRGFRADTDVFDIHLENFTTENGGISCGDCINFTVINATVTNTSEYTNWIYNTLVFDSLNEVLCTNCYAIDTNFRYLAIGVTTNSRLINSIWTDVVEQSGLENVSYYADIYVIDQDGNPISGVTINFTNNINSTILSTDAYGNIQTIFTTDATGHVPMPNIDRTNSPAISWYDVNASNQKTYHTWTVSASASGYVDNSTTMNPNSSWYRSNPNDQNNTTTIILQSELDYIPPNVTSMTYTNGSDWVNHTWLSGSGNITDSYNISHNGIWTNGTTLNYSNNSVGAGTWSNITVYAYNSSGSGTLNSTGISQNVQTPASSFTPSNNTINCPVGWCNLAQNRTNYTLLQLDALFTTDVVQGWFNSSSQKFESHSKYSSNQDANVTMKSGYYYYFSTPTTVYVNITSNPSINLLTGWNLVGNMDTNRTLLQLKTSIGASAITASHWNTTSQQYVNDDAEIVPVGESFFVNVNANSSWSG